jgi:CO dehydrogenase nickel-insertion accessory protein CooC1
MVAGTLARLLARGGRSVLALDSDTMPGLTFSLGVEPPVEPPLLAAAEKNEAGRWRPRKGIGPVRAVQRYATPAPDSVLLLQSGKTTDDGMAPVMGSVNVFYDVVQRIAGSPFFRDWSIVGDLSAGPRQSAYRWATYADTFLLLVEPIWKSALTAQRIARVVRSRSDVGVLLVANKVRDRDDVVEIARRVDEPVFASIPADDAVAEAERIGVPLLDHAPASPAVQAVGDLAERLTLAA